MPFITDIDEFEATHPEDVGPQNPYLSDSQKGLSLVSSLISAGSKRDVKRDRSIDDAADRLFANCGHLDLADETRVASKLKKLIELLKIPAKYRLLKSRTVIGVGGRFSSGKSQFLNSLLENGSTLTLPVNQTPSTSVATYIMHDDAVKVAAITRRGVSISLDADALAAVSHDFWARYRLGLARYIDFMAIGTPHLANRGAVLLDTPGYNKPEGQTMKDFTDRQKALLELRSTDRLIWVIDATNGTILDDDIEFIKNLYISEDGFDGVPKMLIVINKCDLSPEISLAPDPSESSVVRRVREDAANAGLPVADIVPYKAKEDPDWADGLQRVRAFIADAEQDAERIADIHSAIDKIIGDISVRFNTVRAMRQKEKLDLAAGILKAANPFCVSSLVEVRALISREIEFLKDDEEGFKSAADDMRRWVHAQLHS